MTKTIVNLALSIVSEEAENILETYPYHPYQQAFSIPDLRQKLLSYVLSRIPGHYTVVDESEEAAIDLKSVGFSSAQRMQIERLIHQGIQHIFQEDAAWVDRHIPQEVSPGLAPSNWFG